MRLRSFILAAGAVLAGLAISASEGTAGNVNAGGGVRFGGGPRFSPGPRFNTGPRFSSGPRFNTGPRFSPGPRFSRPGGLYARGAPRVYNFNKSPGRFYAGKPSNGFYSAKRGARFSNRFVAPGKNSPRLGNVPNTITGNKTVQKLAPIKNLNQVKFTKHNFFFDKKHDHDHDHDHDWRDHHGHWYGYRWYGPVFWPYAFGDYFSYAFWPYDYYDTFWGYGPDVIVWSAFWPYGEFDDYDYADDDVYAGDIYRPYRRRRAAAPPAAGGSLKDAADTCGNFAPGVSGFPVDRLEKIVDATEEQRKELDELKTASAKAAEILKNGCTAEPALTPVARLDAIEKRLQAMQEADEIVQEPLIKLYDLFSPAQKQRLEAASSERPRGQRPVAHDKPLKLEELCSSQADFTKVPAVRISEQITLTEEQKQQLENLKKASADASDTLKASCPATVPDSFDGRLDAAQKRVTSLIQAIDKARPPIKDFYASLTDEQKAALSMQARPGQTSANNHG